MVVSPSASVSDQVPAGEEPAEAVAAGKAIEGRSLGQIAWRRLKRDRAAMGGAVVIILLILMALLAPLIVKWVGYDPNSFHTDKLDPNTQQPSSTFPFGAFDSKHFMGVDAPFGLSGDTLRIVLLIFIIGFFNWGYIARIIRGQALSLREKEFVDAARSLGARGPYILVREMLPNLIAPILIYATLLIPTNILFEAALSFLGVGIRPPTATWGGMLSDGVRYYTTPHQVFWPGMAVFVTVLAFNLLG